LEVNVASMENIKTTLDIKVASIENINTPWKMSQSLK
jgi:hypothetical protein